jgi:Xaa-Pro aminopeptidase
MVQHLATSEFERRLAAATAAARAIGVGALLVSPGPDLRYLSGYEAVPLERLTCLVLPAWGDPVLVVPELEVAAALASPVADLGLELMPWSETSDPYAMTAQRLGSVDSVAVDNHMWAEKTLRFAAALPGARQRLGGEVLGPLRMRKSPVEVDALREAGAAIDAVHADMDRWLRAGRTEREVGADIAAAIVAAGHVRTDFVIVGSGPNGASPHHELSDRVIERGDPVVIDIGGATAAGYCSDETRMYSIGQPTAEFLESYQLLQHAQWAAVSAIRPGVACQDIDRVARDLITEAGLGDLFIHRTGHGIGLETHEDPYIVSGNTIALEPGFAFSIEPGIYRSGRHGARIEDIAVCGTDGPILMNNRPRDLQIL